LVGRPTKPLYIFLILKKRKKKKKKKKGGETMSMERREG
jgi:hypothetical protein